MDWIKKNPHLLTLSILSLGLAGASAMLIANTQSFDEKFAGVKTSPPQNNKVAPLELQTIDDAQKQLQQSPTWLPKADTGSLFVSKRYYVDGKTGALAALNEGGVPHSRTGQLIPNSWFLQYGLDPLDPAIGRADTDKDGFPNEDEALPTQGPPTDPTRADSHPAYYTQLFLKQFIKVPFRLLFNAYDGDPKKDKPENMSFQINTLDLRQPSEFLKIGDMVRNTKFRIEKFEFKEAPNPKTGEKEDVSELVLLNTETNEPVTLVLTKVVNSPDSYALFAYEWLNKPMDIKVKRLGPFALLPEKDKLYKVLDISETGALIQLPSGEKVQIGTDSRLK